MPNPVIRRDPSIYCPIRVKTTHPTRGVEWWNGFSRGDSQFAIIPPNPEWNESEQTWNVVHLATGRDAGTFWPSQEDAESAVSVLDGSDIFDGDGETVRNRVLENESLMVWWLTCKTLGCFVSPDSL